MKKFKKLLAFGLALIMCLGMAVTASAVPGDATGSITVSNATVGKTYKAYRIFEANVGNGNNIAYTITEAQKAKFDVAVSKLNKTSPFEFVLTASGVYNVEIGTKTPAVIEDGVETAPAVKYTAEEVAAFFSKTQNKVDENGNETAETETVIDEAFLAEIGTQQGGDQIATNATVKFENLPFGYYVITSTLGATLTIDSTAPNANVIDKNQAGPNGLKKVIVVKGENGNEAEIEENSANYGDVIDFKVSLDTTNYEGTSFINLYYIKDEISQGLTYETGTDGKIDVEVTVGTEELKKDKFTVTEKKDADDNVIGFEVKIPWVKLNADGTADLTSGNPEFNYASPNKIVVKYSAKVTDAAAIAGEDAEKNQNTAAFGYTKDNNTGTPTYDQKTETTETYVFALAVQKVDPNGNSLAGAEFTVGFNTGKKDSEGNDIIAPVSVKQGIGDGVYVKCADDDTAKVSFVTTPASGLIVIKGVEAGKYVLTETKAPLGYNLLLEPVTVEASMTNKTSYKTTYYYKIENGEITLLENATGSTTTIDTSFPVTAINVINNTGNLLPSTGGIGTTIFYVVGGLLVAGAGIVLITKKRMKKEQ